MSKVKCATWHALADPLQELQDKTPLDPIQDLLIAQAQAIPQHARSGIDVGVVRIGHLAVTGTCERI
jgi:hypothetical protein